MSNSPLKVAVIGASGIGKNHARWFHQHGCDVRAFAGSSEASIQRTRAILEQGFGFAGRGYSDVAAMLREEELDAVCVSSPPPLHFEQVMACLRAGKHVLCEKPLVYDAALSPATLINQANQLVREAQERGLLLGTQMQYAVAIPDLLALSDHENEPVRDFAMEMESKNVKEGRTGAAIWIDLSPHPLSVLQKLAGDAELNEDSIRCRIDELETEAHFTLRRPDGTPVTARVAVRCSAKSATPLRRFILDGQTVDYVGRKDAQGEFRSYLLAADGRERELPDFVDTLVGNFIAACRGEAPLIVSGADGARNVEWQLKLIA